MIYEKIPETKISNKWNYQIKFMYHYKMVHKKIKNNKIKEEIWESTKAKDHIIGIELFLKSRAFGLWERHGNNVYLMELSDAFNIRLFFAEGISLIRQASSPPL